MGEPGPVLHVLGSRGVPAQHGGFETFAERLSLYLAGRGWEVVVYCQEDGGGPVVEDDWRGVRRVRIPVSVGGPLGTILFDWKSTWHAAGRPGLKLTLGYNTAVFCALYRLRGARNLINMDGIEWRRSKWGPAPRAWFYLNDWLGSWFGDHLVADHPRIADHLATRVRRDKITTIPYGADALGDVDPAPLEALGVAPGEFGIVIARPEPENSILEMVRAFSRRPRGSRLVVLGELQPARSAYHREIQAAASDEVIFPGAIYDAATVNALRRHSLLYLHGHQVGGTNPSLVEALGAGCPVLAHDNHFNRWVAGDAARYFAGEEGCAAHLDALLGDDAGLAALRAAAEARHREAFTWEVVLRQYEELLASWAEPAARPAAKVAG